MKSDTPVDVAEMPKGHPRVRARDWCSPLIHRLLRDGRYCDGKAVLKESFGGDGQRGSEGDLSLAWTGFRQDFEQCINTYQANTLTEYATLALACILLNRHTQLQISEVTQRGESVDYWIGDREVRKRFVLEVGGLQNGSIDTLTRNKTDQLNANPWKRDGFICVAVYSKNVVRLWFCEQGDE